MTVPEFPVHGRRTNRSAVRHLTGKFSPQTYIIIITTVIVIITTVIVTVNTLTHHYYNSLNV